MPIRWQEFEKLKMDDAEYNYGEPISDAFTGSVR